MDEESNSSSAPDETRMDEDPSPQSGSDLERSTSQMRSLNLRSRSDFDSPSNPEGHQSQNNSTPTSSSGSSYVPKTQSAPAPSQVDSQKTGSLPSSWLQEDNSSSPTSSVAASGRSRNSDMQISPKTTESVRSGASSSFRTPQPGRATRRSRRSTANPSHSPSSLTNASPASSSDKRRSSSLQRSSTSNLSSEKIEEMTKEIDCYFEKRNGTIHYLIFEMNYPINLVLDGWVKTETDSDNAIIMLIQFIISCCGCKGEDFTKQEARKIQGEDRTLDPKKIANWMGEKWKRNPNLEHEVFQSKKKRGEFLETINEFWRMFPQKCSLEFCCNYLKDPILELLIDISDYKTKEKDTYMNFYIPSMSIAICIGTGLLIRGLSRVALRDLFHQILNSVFRPRIWLNVKELDLVFAEEYAKWIFKMPSILDEDLRTGEIHKTLFYHRVDEVRKITLKGLLKVFETHDTSKTKDFVTVAFMVAGDSLRIESVSPTAINIMRICKQHPNIEMLDALNGIEKYVYWKIYSFNRDEAKAVGHYINDVIMEDEPNTKGVLKDLIDFYNDFSPGSMARLTKVMIDINEALVDWTTMVDILQTDFSEPDFALMVNLIVNCVEHVATYEPINQDKDVMRERQIHQVTKHFGPVITELIEGCLDPLDTKVLSNLVKVPRFLLINRLEQKGLAEPLFELLCNLLEQDLSDVLLNQISETLKSFDCIERFADLRADLCEKVWTNFLGYFGLISTEIDRNSALSIDSLDKLYTTLKQLYALICYYKFTNIGIFGFNELNKAAVFFEINFEQQQHYAGLILKYLGRVMATALFWRSEEDLGDLSVLSETELGERENAVNTEVMQFVQIAKQILSDPNEFHECSLKREIFKLSCDVAKRQIDFINDQDFSRLLSEFVDSYLFVDAFATDANSTDDIKYLQTISLAMFRAYCQLVVYNCKLYRPETLLKHYKDKEKYDRTCQQKYFEIIERVVDELKKLNRNALINDMYICLLRQFKNDVDSETPNSMKNLEATADHFLHLIKFRAGDEVHLEMLHRKMMENALKDEENLTMFATLYTFLIHLSDSAKDRLLIHLKELLNVEHRKEIEFSIWVTNYNSFLEKKTGSKQSKKKRKPGKGYPTLDVTVEHSSP